MIKPAYREPGMYYVEDVKWNTAHFLHPEGWIPYDLYLYASFAEAERAVQIQLTAEDIKKELNSLGE